MLLVFLSLGQGMDFLLHGCVQLVFTSGLVIHPASGYGRAESGRVVECSCYTRVGHAKKFYFVPLQGVISWFWTELYSLLWCAVKRKKRSGLAHSADSYDVM